MKGFFSERLRLEPLRSEHVQPYLALCETEAVRAGMICEPIVEDVLLSDIADHAAVPLGEREWLAYTVFSKESGDLLGLASLRCEDELRVEAEIGFELGEAYWGKGYGTEMVAALVSVGFKRHGFQRIWAACLESNEASQAVLEKNGFLFESEEASGDDRTLLTYGLMRDAK